MLARTAKSSPKALSSSKIPAMGFHREPFEDTGTCMIVERSLNEIEISIPKGSSLWFQPMFPTPRVILNESTMAKRDCALPLE